MPAHVAFEKLDMRQTPLVVLLTSDPDRYDRWSGIVARAECRAVTPERLESEDQRPDLLITDQPLSTASLGKLDDGLANGDVATIGIGTGGFFDVDLPEDYSDRELKLACLLLAENVRLRRVHRRDKRLVTLYQQLASSDPLTGLPNRRAWDEYVAQQVKMAIHSKRSICVGLIDLDHFKVINERYGLIGGDKVLKTFGQSLGRLITKPDFAARLGGDEFGVILLSDRNQPSTSRFDQLRTTASQQVMEFRKCHCTASAGFIDFDGRHSNDASESKLRHRLIKAADVALRRAKDKGRNKTISSE